MIVNLVLALASIAILLTPWLMDAGMSYQLRKTMKTLDRQSNQQLQHPGLSNRDLPSFSPWPRQQKP